MNLYFINSKQERQLITAYSSASRAISDIRKFVQRKNPGFQIYYTRCWETEEGTMYDIGSHTEFFLLKK